MTRRETPGPSRAWRSTRQLEATYRALRRRDDHPSAEQIYTRVRAELPLVSRGTVYRNLQKLLEQERIRIVTVPGRAARYDHRVDDHDHFVCTRCGDVLDVSHRDPRGTERMRELGGHRIEAVAVTYFGRCHGCRPGAGSGAATRPA